MKKLMLVWSTDNNLHLICMDDFASFFDIEFIAKSIGIKLDVLKEKLNNAGGIYYVEKRRRGYYFYAKDEVEANILIDQLNVMMLLTKTR